LHIHMDFIIKGIPKLLVYIHTAHCTLILYTRAADDEINYPDDEDAGANNPCMQARSYIMCPIEIKYLLYVCIIINNRD